jgi:hypothetical protein
MDVLFVPAILVWSMATLMSYAYATDLGEPFLKRISLAIKIDLGRSAGRKVIPSMWQAISIYWILLGLVINWIGAGFPKNFSEEVVLSLIMGTPLLAFTIILKIREGKVGK